MDWYVYLINMYLTFKESWIQTPLETHQNRRVTDEIQTGAQMQRAINQIENQRDTHNSDY